MKDLSLSSRTRSHGFVETRLRDLLFPLPFSVVTRLPRSPLALKEAKSKGHSPLFLYRMAKIPFVGAGLQFTLSLEGPGSFFCGIPCTSIVGHVAAGLPPARFSPCLTPSFRVEREPPLSARLLRREIPLRPCRGRASAQRFGPCSSLATSPRARLEEAKSKSPSPS